MTDAPSRPTRRSARKLSTDERTLWKTVTQSVSPLSRALVDDQPEEAAAAGDVEAPKAPKPAPAAPSPRPKPEPKGPPPLAPLGRRLRQKLVRGTESIDARIDLHGKTQQAAHAALMRFVRTAQAEGAKTVLVVTGKGGPRSDGDPYTERGVLRRQVPLWLTAPELRDVVLGVEAAHAGHGGEGALYVRLRRADRRR